MASSSDKPAAPPPLLPSAVRFLRHPLSRHHHRRSPWSTRRLPLLIVLSGAAVMMLFYLLLSLAPCLVSGACFRGWHSPYSFDANLAHHSKWMRDIPDNVNITSLSIPGTHDTMTYHIKKFPLQCQNWNLWTQLNAGVRYLDIRARLQDNTLHIFHASEPTGYSYQDVLTTAFAFLDANPSETIVMRLKEEGGPVGDKNFRSFQEAFNWARFESPVTSNGSHRHLYIYNDTSLPIPSLGKLRSKIFILQNWVDHSPGSQTYGLKWEGPQMILEDKWIIPDTAHLEDKWQAIKSALEKAKTDAPDNQHIYLAHISASVGVLPIEAAAGTKNNTYPIGMNEKTSRWAEEHLIRGVRTGIVIFDFPGKKAIESILAWNKHFKKRSIQTWA
ncbi:PLC-like phosphodiesterase, TIM beta/alpha-barrel domain protein [Moelleriella libera RCEF 2490]|uniref:PLC-like phosphodiesterase, TIM beta/alpha-barrel domain protein n=1 Tax=Moelleriella libera RCEF 2490 TaxID=1081109 RepID=A0A167ZF87_9HYPO|nr:PLC-like phosphodiesterase, TIM beta/alpha-barrel domain protein [Moelleriella libera RCEF 2490]